MSEAPERIWRVKPWHPSQYQHGLASWPVEAHAGPESTEYTRADLVDARVKQAREAALREAADLADELAIEMEVYHAIPTTTTKSKALCIRNRILALISEDKNNG